MKRLHSGAATDSGAVCLSRLSVSLMEMQLWFVQIVICSCAESEAPFCLQLITSQGRGIEIFYYTLGLYIILFGTIYNKVFAEYALQL
jgi:hypothetical protein